MKTALLTSLLFCALSLGVTAVLAAVEPAAAGEKAELQKKYSDAIREIELSSGAYDRRLIEPLRSLASLLNERGEYEAAVQVYGRLLHLNRINNGFYHPGHLQIVRKIIEANTARADWRDLDDNHDYLYWLYQRVYEDDPEHLAAGMGEVLDWKLTFLPLNGQGDKTRALLELEEISEQRLKVLAAAPDAGYPAVASALYQRAMLHYLYVLALDEGDLTGRHLLDREGPPPDPQRTAGWVGLRRVAPVARSLFPVNKVRPVIDSHLLKGRRLLERVEKMAELEPPERRSESRGMARLHSADWYLLMGRKRVAMEAYREAYQLLLDAGIPVERVDAFFARPRVLPQERFSARLPTLDELDGGRDETRLDDFRAWSKAVPGVNFPQTNRDYLSTENGEYVELKLNVGLDGKVFNARDPRFTTIRDARGNTSRVRIVDDGGRGDHSRRRALDRVEQLVFRPRLEQGRPVASKGLRMRYYYSLDD